MKKNVLNIALFTAMLLVSTSCATQRVTTPNVADELNYTREIQEKYKANAEWWTQYNNAELNKLVNMALQNNPDYLKAALKINQELYRLNLATADLFPTLSGDLGASGQRRIDTSDNVSNNFSGEIGLGYEVDLYGKIRNLQNAQEFEYQATILDKETAKLSLVNSVVDLFFNLEYISNSIDLSRQNVKMYEDIRDIAEAKYKTGKADNVEYLEAKQSLLSEQNRLLTLETQFKEMETSLKNIFALSNVREIDISNFNIKNVKDISGMFQKNSNLERIFMNNIEFNEETLENFDRMFANVKSNIEIYVKNIESAQFISERLKENSISANLYYDLEGNWIKFSY